MKTTTMNALCQAFSIGLALLAPSLLAAEDIVTSAQDTIHQICAPYENWQPGPAARPTEADRQAFGAERDCFAYFYGEDNQPDYDKGRRCCLILGGCNRELGMTFANGWGTPRDLDAATYFLCRASGELGAFEQKGMLEFVQSLRSGTEKRPLDYCDHATSGAGMGMCAGLDYTRQKAGWDQRIADVEMILGADAKPALAALRKAADDLTDADGELIAEGNRGGSGYAGFVLDGKAKRGEVFVDTLERYTLARGPKTTAKALKSADDALNTAFETRMAEMKDLDQRLEKLSPGDGILRDAQRAWIRYRNAWTAFYRLCWKGQAPPEILDQEIVAALTQDRTKDLEEMGKKQ